MRLVSVLNRAATIEFDAEELFVLAESMGDAWRGRTEGGEEGQGEVARLMLLEAWGAAFKGMAMAGAACSYIPKAHEEQYTLRGVEREFTRDGRARKRA